MIRKVATALYGNSIQSGITKAKRKDKHEEIKTTRQQNNLNCNLFPILHSKQLDTSSNTGLPSAVSARRSLSSSLSSLCSSRSPGMLLLLSLVIVSTVFLPPVLTAWADAGHIISERGSGGARGTAKSLGWVAIGAGLMANVPFLAFVRVKKLSVVSLGGGHEITRGLAVRHPTMLNFHMAMNGIGFVAGITHGVLLIRGLDAISLALAITMTVLVASGAVLRFAPWKNGGKSYLKNYTRVLHSQLMLSGLLVVLIILHLVSVGVLD